MRNQSLAIAATSIIGAALALACGGSKQQARQPAGQTTLTSAPATETESAEEQSGYTPTSLEVYVTGQAPAPCGIDGLRSITFPLGSSKLGPAQDPEIRRLATCLSQRPFELAPLTLIGHSDPMGSPTYDAALGLARARSVKAQLVAYGVAADRIDVTSAIEKPLPPEQWDEARAVAVAIRPETAPDGGPLRMPRDVVPIQSDGGAR